MTKESPEASSPKPDAATIDRVCELLFNAASLSERAGEHIVQFRAEHDTEMNVLYFSIVVSAELFPPELRARITPAVERQVIAFFRDMDVVVKPIQDAEWGACYEIDLPGELRGASWDEMKGTKKGPRGRWANPGTQCSAQWIAGSCRLPVHRCPHPGSP